MTVQPHWVPDEVRLERESMHRVTLPSVEILKSKPKQIGLVQHSYFELSACRAVLHSNHSIAALVEALTTLQLLFARSPAGNASKSASLRGVQIDIGTAPTISGFISPSSWQRRLFLAIALRDEAEGTFAAEYPLEALPASRSTAPAYAHTFCEALAGFRLDWGGWNETLARAIAEAEADDSVGAHTTDIDLPLMRLLAVIYSGAEPFNTALHDALIGHRRYYGHKDRAHLARGFLALGLAALAAWAFDCDTEITVESDYMPRWLVEGQLER